MFGLINTRVFLISFSVGIFFAYISEPERKVIHIFPSPDNVDQIVYKDGADSCFKYAHEEVGCALDAKDMGVIPVQPSVSAVPK
jgi:hypothetical protein